METKPHPQPFAFLVEFHSTNSDRWFSKERGVICPPIVSITVRHLHVYYHLYTDILHSITHKIIALHVLNSIQIQPISLQFPWHFTPLPLRGGVGGEASFPLYSLAKGAGVRLLFLLISCLFALFALSLQNINC